MKRLLLITLSLAALLSLSACGDKDDNTPDVLPQTPPQAQTGEQAGETLPGEQPQTDPAAADASGATELLSFTCYEDFPQVPDFGVLNGYELAEVVAGEYGSTIYYYLSHYGDDDLKAEFWYDAARFSQAVQQQGYESVELSYGDALLRTESCGD